VAAIPTYQGFARIIRHRRIPFGWLSLDRIGKPWPLDLPCGEQGKLPTAKNSSCRKGTSTMSEQEKPKSFMQELDLWSEQNIFRPLFGTDPNQDDWDKVEDQVKKAIRAKVLESYRNGQAAGPRQPVPERRTVYQRRTG
jgi:hypothetical protein